MALLAQTDEYLQKCLILYLFGGKNGTSNLTVRNHRSFTQENNLNLGQSLNLDWGNNYWAHIHERS